MYPIIVAIIVIVIVVALIGIFYSLFRTRNKDEKENKRLDYITTTKPRYRKLTSEEEIEFLLQPLKGHKRFIFNSYIPISNKKNELRTTEIDLIMIHETGIYVFERKNFKWIKGYEKEDEWEGYNSRDGRVLFNNPLIQNENHINILSRYLDNMDIKHFRSYIVFNNECGFLETSIFNPFHHLVHLNELYDAIKSQTENSLSVLNEEEIEDIYQILKAREKDNVDVNVILEHNQYVKSKKLY